MTCEVCGIDIGKPSPNCAADHPPAEPIGYLIVTGNPVDGFQFTGWWGASDEAQMYGEVEFDNDIDWWIAPLYAPREQE